MNILTNITRIGITTTASYQERRGILITNYVSIILFAGMCILFMMLTGNYKNLADSSHVPIGAFLFLTPIILNRFSFTGLSRLFVSIVPTLYLWYIFIHEMSLMESIPVTVYDGLRVYLLAVTCIPYLVLTRKNTGLFLLAVLPSFISVFFFEWIREAAGLGFQPAPGDDYLLMQPRFVLSYGVISLGCYMLQSVILKNDEYNKQLIESLHEKQFQIESQNQELKDSRNRLRIANQDLEKLLEDRTEKMTVQQKRIISYAHANSHSVRGPVARLMGLVELYKLDQQLDHSWLLGAMEREAKEIDKTTRRISAELSPLE